MYIHIYVLSIYETLIIFTSTIHIMSFYIGKLSTCWFWASKVVQNQYPEDIEDLDSEDTRLKACFKK